MDSLHILLQVNKLEDDVYRVLSAIKPDWEKDLIQIKNLEGGFSCIMKHCCCQSDSTSSISFRIRNLFVDSPLTDSDFEVQVLKALSENNLFPRIYATFENGYCYEYVNGKPLINFPLRNSIRLNQNVLRAVATQLAEIHSTPIPETESEDYFVKLAKLLQSDFGNDTNVLPSKESLRRELMFVESYIREKSFNSSLVLCHGDLHIFNLLKKDDDSIQFLDWELTHVNYRAFDMAFFFQTVTSIGMANKVRLNLPKNAELKFINYYAQKCKLYQDTDIDVNDLYCQVQIYKLVVLLYLMITQSAYAGLAEMVAKNPKEYHTKLMNDYLKKKAAVMGVHGLEK